MSGMIRGSLLLVFVWSLGQAVGLLSAAEPINTGEKRDTLLYIRTDPPGAKVFINGEEVGTSDGLFKVEPGSGTILVELEGREPGERQVIVRANAITRVELSLDPKPDIETQDSLSIRQLPQGSVELVGITRYPPTKESQWWKPDGSPIQLGTFLPKSSRGPFPAREKAFLFRFRNQPEDTPVWKTTPSADWWASAVVDGQGKTVDGYRMLTTDFADSVERAGVRVGIDMGPWETVITQQADRLSSASFSRAGRESTVTFQKMEVRGRAGRDSTRVTFTSNERYGDWRRRLVAVTKDGSEHATRINSMGSVCMADFQQLQPSSIKEFRYQVRPFHWGEFENISLAPEQKTTPRAITSTPNQDMRFLARWPQGTAEVVGITRYPPTKDSEWWKPDGSPIELGTFLPKSSDGPSHPHENSVAMLVRFRDQPAGTSHVWKTTPNAGWWASAVVDEQGKTIDGYSMLIPDFDETVERASIHVGIDGGDWETVITQQPDDLGPSSFRRGGGESTITFLKAEARDRAGEDSTRVTLTSDERYGEWRRRLVAVAKDGTEHAARLNFMGSNGTADFRGLPPSSIKEFRYQVRSFDWVEFENISLSPMQNPPPNVVTLTPDEDTRLMAHWPQGTVELVGITDFPPTKESRWWKPDGSEVDLGPFLARPTQSSFAPDKAFLLRFKNLPADAAVPAKSIEPRGSWESTGVLDVHGRKLKEYGLFCPKLGMAAIAHLRMGIDTGAWETVVVQKADNPGTSTYIQNGRETTFTLGQPEAHGMHQDDSTRVPYTTDKPYGKWKTRFVGVTEDGTEHEAWTGDVGGKGAAIFWKMPLGSIKEFRLQARSYSWVEFKNIALQPGVETDVEVVSAAAQDRRFVGHWPQGSVELVGIAAYPPNEESQWWKPDGSPADLGPFLARPDQQSVPLKRKPLALLLRIKDMAKDASWPAWDIEPGGNWSATEVLNSQGEKVKEYDMFCAEFGKWTKTAIFRAGIDSGEWETVCTQRVNDLGSSDFDVDGHLSTVTLVQAKPDERRGGNSTRVDLTSNEPYGSCRSRLVAVTDDGSEHAAWISSSGGEGSATFVGVPVSSIKEFRFQIRPYKWIEFKDFALQPGQKTNVEVISSGDSEESKNEAPKR